MSQGHQELGNWDAAVAVFEKITEVAHGDIQSLVPKSWIRDVNGENIACLRLLLAIRNAVSSSSWSDVEVGVVIGSLGLAVFERRL